MPGDGVRPAFFRNVRDVRIVAISQRSTAVAMASRPAVKFKLTGIFPAQVAADVGEGAADRRRQQQSDGLALRHAPPDRAREQEAADQRAAKRQLAAGRVGDAERRPPALGRAEEPGGEGIQTENL